LKEIFAESGSVKIQNSYSCLSLEISVFPLFSSKNYKTQGSIPPGAPGKILCGKMQRVFRKSRWGVIEAGETFRP